ncbi:hypothetical protein [Actinoplanes philippinensis]|uniref:hypothetical protein n=1 Tax=Actinoplanes philippinensis TaxID=35752 RepID=UPI0033C547E1
MHLVVTCTHRKRQAVAPHLRLGHLDHTNPAARFTAWTTRLGSATDARYRAIDLYAGEHWQVVRSITTAAPPVVLWVASAGYGLIPAEVAICSYGATFSAGRDTVGATASQVADWWRRLGDWAGPAPDQPRTFTDLVRQAPDAKIIAVLSEAYQRACAADILTAATSAEHDALSVIGPPGVQPDLADLLVPVTARLRHTVGGSLQALNVRVAQHLLAHGAGHGRSDLRAAAAAAEPAETPAARPTGRPMSDDEVVAYIHSQPHSSATQLLRRLRDTGRSCEQARFGRLHRDACRECPQGRQP